MSDTPRTDTLVDAHHNSGIGAYAQLRETTAFARVLERENAALRARLAEVEDERNRLRECSDFNQLQCENALANLARTERERDEAQLRLTALGDIAVGNWDDATVGAVDSVVKEPRRYKDALRVLFVDNPKTIAQLRADNARLREVLEDIERCSELTSEGSWCRQQARAALAQTEDK